MQITEGNGGWFAVDGVESLPGVLYVRVTEVDGRPRLTELYVDGRGEPIPGAALRKLPLPVLEEWTKAVGSETRRGVPGPDLSTLASYFSASWGRPQDACESCSAPLSQKAIDDLPNRALLDWTALSWLSRIPGEGVIPKVARRRRSQQAIEMVPDVVLSAPEGGLTDEFLSDVARAYSAAVQRRQPPATTLAQLAGVERRTVESWIYKARKREIMPPAAKRGRIV